MKLEFFGRGRQPEKIPAPERVDQTPFIIRGHHLKNFYELQQATKGKIRSLEQHMVNFVRAGWQSKILIGLDQETIEIAKATGVFNYVADVIGTSPKEHERYYQQIRNIYQEFLQLDPSYPVKISVTPDKICDACIIGQHCKQLSIGGDGAYIQAFIQRLEERPKLKNGEITITTETHAYTNQQFATVLTTAGTIRNVLGSLKSFYNFVK